MTLARYKVRWTEIITYESLISARSQEEACDLIDEMEYKERLLYETGRDIDEIASIWDEADPEEPADERDFEG